MDGARGEVRFDHVSGRLIPSGDAMLYVEEKGSPERPALLLAHGGFGTMEDFNVIVPDLARRFRLIGLDSRGHGRSSLGESGLSYALFAQDLGRVAGALGLDAFSVLGFSDGGIAACRLAAQGEPRLDRIVTVGSRWEMRKDDPVYGMLRGVTGEVWKSMFPDSVKRYMRLNPEPDFERFAAAVTAMWTDLGPGGLPGDLVRHIENEMFAVRGDDDPLTTLASMAKLRGVVKNMRFMNIPFAGHAAFDDAPGAFLDDVFRFLTPPSRSPA